MKLPLFIFSSLFMLNGCAYYSAQLGLGDYSKFCSNQEEDRERKNEKYFISDTHFFYIAKNGEYYSEQEFGQLTSPSVININYGGISAKELKDTSKKVFTIKYTNTKTNTNICSSRLVSDDEFEKRYSNSVIGRKVLISTDKMLGSSGKEIYSNSGKKGLSITYI